MTTPAQTPLGNVHVLREAVRGQRRSLVVSALLAVGHQLSEAAVPVLVGVVLDRAVGTGDESALGGWLAVVAGVFVVLAGSAAVGYWLMDRARLRAGRDVRLGVAARVLDAAGGAPGRPGEQVGLASSDADRAASIVSVLPQVASKSAALVAGTAVLFAISPWLALVVLAGVPLVLLASRLLARPLVGRAETEQATLAATTSTAADLITGLRVVKGIGAERAAGAAYARTSRTALRARLAAVTVEGGYLSVTTALTGAFLVVVVWVGGRLALAGTISIGELVAAVGLAQFLLEPMEELTRLGPLVAGARGAAGRVAQFLAAPPAVGPALRRAQPAETLPEPVEGQLRIQHRGLTLDLAAGEHLGVVVMDGATAADLLDVLGRDREPSPPTGGAGGRPPGIHHGVICLDGIDLQKVSLDSARAALLVARHDAALFEGTLADNVATDGARDPDGLAPALAASAADEVRDTMPAGLDTEIGERGRTLSGGQRQRVALARALAADPAVLVLHDPTTAIDAATEDRIAEGIAKHRAGRGTLLVTSSPALLARCDRVLLVVDGAVAAEGRHADLVRHPAYAQAVLS